MGETTTETLKRTPLYDLHEENGVEEEWHKAQ